MTFYMMGKRNVNWFYLTVEDTTSYSDNNYFYGLSTITVPKKQFKSFLKMLKKSFPSILTTIYFVSH